MNDRTTYKDLVPLVEGTYTSTAGCCWHVVVEDQNFDKGCIDSCAQIALTEVVQADHPSCVALAKVMTSGKYSITQLRKACACARRW